MSCKMTENKLPRTGATALEVLDGIDLKDKYALITGANSGIGFETARALAVHNAHVTIACRNVVTASEAKDKILDEKEDADITIVHLDLSDLSSVEECANEYIDSNKPLHMLILNAGVYNPIHRVTDAGFEATFQINHLAQFYLTNLLQQTLIKSAPARVVVVASDAQMTIRSMRPVDMTWDKFSPTHKNGLNSAYNAYALSKFSNTLFAFELNRRLADQQVSAYSLHPGIIRTEIGRNSGVLSSFLGFWGRPFTSTQGQGAATSTFCATWPDLEKSGGKYFSKCRVKNPASPAQNPETAKQLWELSEEMIEHYKTSIEE